jgi:hypothetical protein
MRHFLVFTALMATSCVSFASTQSHDMPARVAFQVNDQAWVTTNTAQVNVAVNATLSHSSVSDAKAQIIEKLQSLAKKGHWHITQFNQNTDQSGLLQINLVAQARLNQNLSATLYKRVVALSKRGQKYSISNISYTPSLHDVERVRGHLRDRIYAQVNAQIPALDKVSGEKYQVQSISFDQQVLPMEPGPVMTTMMVRRVSNARSMPIGHQMRMTANVILRTTLG